MRTATIMLDGKEHEIKEMRHRQNKEWRKVLEGHIETLASAVEEGMEGDISDATKVAQLIRVGIRFVIRSTDLMCELVVEYLPNLAEQLENGYDSEIADAFVEVVKLAYPFSKVFNILKQLSSELPQTPRSSPLQNGESGTTR